VGDVSHRGLPLLHGLQKGGLGFWGSTVDFIGEDDVGEDRAGKKPESILGKNVGAKNIRGHEVRGALNAGKGQAQCPA
jgi:hypothetical protein